MTTLLLPISVTAPLGPAFARLGRTLFSPFRFRRWLALGLCDFLAAFCEGQDALLGVYALLFGGLILTRPGAVMAPPSAATPAPGPFDSLEAFSAFTQAHLGTILLVLLAVATILFFIYVAWRWLTCRGRFMLLRGVIDQDPNLGLYWRESKMLANSLLKFRIYWDLLRTNVYLVILLLGLGLAWPAIRDLEWNKWATAAAVVAAALTLIAAIVLTALSALVEGFLVPAMFRHHLRAWPACKKVYREIIRPYPGPIALFLFTQLIIVIAATMAANIVQYFSLYTSHLAYIGNVILLPMTVFEQLYCLYFLQQFGPEWQLLPFAESSAARAFPVILDTDKRGKEAV